jgi:hypothetical protein
MGRSSSRKLEGSEIERDVERSPARTARAKLAAQATTAACGDERQNLDDFKLDLPVSLS